MTKRSLHNSVVFYEGPSRFNQTPIVGILTGLRLTSNNRKTGDMLQAWILVRDQSPTDAIRAGADAAICGDCSLRGDGVHGRGCYVTYWQAPRMIWQTLPTLARVDTRTLGFRILGRSVRLGAYGDPVAIPAPVWTSLLRHVETIGYTQQWREPATQDYRGFLMASVLSSVAQEDARALGWRTYRVRGPLDPLAPGEVICPASHEAGQKLTCQACLLCGGADSRRQGNPTIVAHGKPGNLKVFGVRPRAIGPYR